MEQEEGSSGFEGWKDKEEDKEDRMRRRGKKSSKSRNCPLLPSGIRFFFYCSGLSWAQLTL